MKDAGNLDPWVQFFKSNLDRPLPPDLETFNEDMQVIEQRDRNLWWKLKGIASKTTQKLLSKYGNPKVIQDPIEQ